MVSGKHLSKRWSRDVLNALLQGCAVYACVTLAADTAILLLKNIHIMAINLTAL